LTQHEGATLIFDEQVGGHDIVSRLGEQAMFRGGEVRDIMQQFWSVAVRAYSHELGIAASADREEEQGVHLARASQVLNRLEELKSHLCALDSVLGHGEVRDLWQAVATMCHFETAPYLEVRRRESALLENIASDEKVDPLLLLGALEPWALRDTDPVLQAARNALYKRLVSTAEERVAARLPQRLREPDAVSIESDGVADLSLRHVLLRRESPVWVDPVRSELLSVLTVGEAPVTSNAMAVLRILAGEASVQGSSRATLQSDLDAVRALWICATRTPVNSRFLARLSEIRNHLDKRGEVLALPAWWARVDADLKRATARNQRDPSGAALSSDPVERVTPGSLPVSTGTIPVVSIGLDPNVDAGDADPEVSRHPPQTDREANE